MNNNIKESPILFSGPMVKAIREGRKTQTRRVVRYNPPSHCNVKMVGNLARFTASSFAAGYHGNGITYDREITCPYGQPGYRLWVRETWTYITKSWDEHFDAIRPDPITSNGCPVDLLYRADGYEIPARWQPSIFMPRWASRLTLEVIKVWVERLQDISEADAIAEGIKQSDRGFWLPGGYDNAPILAYRDLWDSINGKRPSCSWNDNPWVWVVEFKRVETAGVAQLPGM